MFTSSCPASADIADHVMSTGHNLKCDHWDITALFNNTRTLKFKAQPTNAFFAAVSQTFGGSSQLTITAEHCFVVWTVLNNLITAPSAVVGSWEEPTSIWLTVAKNAFDGWALNFRVRKLLKGAVAKDRSETHCKVKEALLTRELKPLNDDVSSEIGLITVLDAILTGKAVRN